MGWDIFVFITLGQIGVKNKSDNSYYCECPLGFHGSICDHRRTCQSAECHPEHSYCADNSICACLPNPNNYYNVSLCDPIYDCIPNMEQCLNGGKCKQYPNGGYYCVCSDDYEGVICEKKVGKNIQPKFSPIIHFFPAENVQLSNHTIGFDCLCGAGGTGNHHTGHTSRRETSQSHPGNVLTIQPGDVWQFSWRDSQATARGEAHLDPLFSMTEYYEESDLFFPTHLIQWFCE